MPDFLMVDFPGREIILGAMVLFCLYWAFKVISSLMTG